MTGIQLELPIPQPHAPTLNLVGLTIQVLAQSEWVTPAEIQREIYRRTGEWHSDSSITARIRDGRKPCYGSHLIDKRKRENSRSYEYKLVLP